MGFFRRIIESIVGGAEYGRSGKWPRVRAEHLAKNPACIACGRTDREMEVHHKRSYKEHPEDELNPSNLRTLCADPCHIVWGHFMDFKLINEDIDEFCKQYREARERAKR